MKRFILIILLPLVACSVACANGPLFQHKDTYTQQEFENIYQQFKVPTTLSGGILSLGKSLYLNQPSLRSFLVTSWNPAYGNNYASMYFGWGAGEQSDSGAAHVTGVGSEALFFNQGNYNHCFGDNACGSNTTGIENHAFGFQALTSNTVGLSNAVFGNAAAQSAIDVNNMAVFGDGAAQFVVHGSPSGTLQSGRFCIFGAESYQSMITSFYDNCFGFQCLTSATNGPNAAFGYNSGAYIVAGSSNTLFGNFTSGVSGSAIVNGNFNSWFGHNIGENGDYSNTVAMGHDITVTGSNQAYIGGLPGSSNAVSLTVGGIKGSTQAVTTGNVGEYLVASSVTYVSQSGSTNWDNVVQLTLSTGAWTITGVEDLTQNGATVTRVICALSINSAATTSDQVHGDNELDGYLPTANSDSTCIISAWHQVLNAQTTVYLKSRSSYSVANPQFKGRISALRDPH